MPSFIQMTDIPATRAALRHVLRPTRSTSPVVTHPVSMRTYINAKRFFKAEDFDQDILSMLVTDGCAVECVRVIDAAEVLMGLMSDNDGSYLEPVRQAVICQCEMYYFG